VYCLHFTETLAIVIEKEKASCPLSIPEQEIDQFTDEKCSERLLFTELKTEKVNMQHVPTMESHNCDFGSERVSKTFSYGHCPVVVEFQMFAKRVLSVDKVCNETVIVYRPFVHSSKSYLLPPLSTPTLASSRPPHPLHPHPLLQLYM
jgi:hypothetical protein